MRGIISPDSRRAILKNELKRVKKELKRKYSPKLKAAGTRTEKQKVRDEITAEIEKKEEEVRIQC